MLLELSDLIRSSGGGDVIGGRGAVVVGIVGVVVEEVLMDS